MAGKRSTMLRYLQCTDPQSYGCAVTWCVVVEQDVTKGATEERDITSDIHIHTVGINSAHLQDPLLHYCTATWYVTVQGLQPFLYGHWASDRQYERSTQ